MGTSPEMSLGLCASMIYASPIPSIIAMRVQGTGCYALLGTRPAGDFVFGLLRFHQAAHLGASLHPVHVPPGILETLVVPRSLEVDQRRRLLEECERGESEVEIRQRPADFLEPRCNPPANTGIDVQPGVGIEREF